MAFEAKDYAISDILNKSVFDIPRNQRRYVWKKPHWQDLHEDIVFSITETKPHFVGSILEPVALLFPMFQVWKLLVLQFHMRCSPQREFAVRARA